MSIPHITHKRGDSFDLVATIPAKFVDGQFAGYTPSAQMRTAAGAMLADLQVAWVDDTTTRTLRLTCIDTTSWLVGPAKFDVQFRRDTDGFIVSTATTNIQILEDVTRPT